MRSLGLNFNPKMFRFLANDLENYDYYMVKDIDEPISEFDKYILDYHIKNYSNNLFSIIKDHRYHHAKVLGGFFGGKTKLFNMKKILIDWNKLYTKK